MTELDQVHIHNAMCKGHLQNAINNHEATIKMIDELLQSDDVREASKDMLGFIKIWLNIHRPEMPNIEDYLKENDCV